MSNITPVDQLKSTLSSPATKQQLQAALPPHVSVDKFLRVMMTTVTTSPDLLKADRATLFSSMAKAAADGLLPDGREAAIVVYGDKAQYQPMFQGILKKMRNSGELKSIQTQIVHAKDNFQYWIDETGEHIMFRPDMMADRGEPVGVFSIGETKDGGTYIDVMRKDEIEKIKNVSRSGKNNNGPWGGPFYLEMWKKTSIRRIAKKMPSSTDIDQVFSGDDEDYEFEPVISSNVSEKNPSVQDKPAKRESRMDALKKASSSKDVEKHVESVENQEPLKVEAQVLTDDQIPI